MKKQLLILLFLALFVSLAYGIKIDESGINVIVYATGNPLVEETYLVSFSDENELNEFRESSKIDISLDLLRNFGLDIKPEFAGDEPAIILEEQENLTRIKLTYFSSVLFNVNKKITFDEFSLNKNSFSFLLSGNNYLFPENFSLRFVFPRESRISQTIIPKTNVVSKTVEFDGPIMSQDFFLSYAIDKTPEPIEIKQTTIEINVINNGFAQITEKYFFEFKSQEELDYFWGIYQKNGTSTEDWKTFDERFFPHVSANDNDVYEADFKFEPSEQNGLSESYLKLTYENESPLFIEQKERLGRFVEWSFNQKKLDSFLSGDFIKIPENTLIEISLPLNAEIKENNLSTEGKKVVWQGPDSTSSINLVYVIKENIAP
ncbi:hypothetical protein KKB11_06520, partial [Candidatus Micrarchaeota archaeon]|nr:hypothetical protein [Candidatus Micrarchaeota archaeon]